MEQSHAQRRLVKSPPELWAELSSEDSLGRHLAEFGEIRITRVEPETTVAWEGDRASGTVQIAPTGWGTKVTLTATAVAEPELAEPVVAEPVVAEPIAAEPEPQPVVAEPEPVEPPPAPVARISLREPDSALLGEHEPEPDPVPRRFFARFFRRQSEPVEAAVQPAQPEPATVRSEIPTPPAPMPDPSPPTPAPDPTPPAPMPGPAPQPMPDPVPPSPAPRPGPGPPPTIEAAAHRAAPVLEPAAGAPTAQPAPEPVDTMLGADRTVAILTEILDDLGAAHHRPFSRG